MSDVVLSRSSGHVQLNDVIRGCISACVWDPESLVSGCLVAGCGFWGMGLDFRGRAWIAKVVRLSRGWIAGLQLEVGV